MDNFVERRKSTADENSFLIELHINGSGDGNVPRALLFSSEHLKLIINHITMSTKAKLHELVAIQNDADGRVKLMVAETIKVFDHQRHLFQGHTKITKAFDDSKSQELDETENVIRTTTVPARLEYTFREIIVELNRSATIDRTNCTAKADLVVDGVVLVRDVPATTFLGLERRAKLWLDMLKKVPTLPTGIAWELAPDQGADVFVTKHPTVKNKTKPVTSVIELSPATKEHKAQVKEVVSDVAVASMTTTQYNGMVTPEYMAALCLRAEKLIEAAKTGRTRANEAEVEDLKMGEVITAWLLHGTTPQGAAA